MESNQEGQTQLPIPTISPVPSYDIQKQLICLWALSKLISVTTLEKRRKYFAFILIVPFKLTGNCNYCNS